MIDTFSVLSDSRRIIAVGDIHGCLLSLKKLIEEVGLEPEDQLVFLGDMMDRGSQTRGVIEFVMKLRKRYNCHFLMGNHEKMFLDYLENGNAKWWFENGGRATLKSYGCKKGLDLPREHVNFLKGFHYFLETENFVFVHGGLDPEMNVSNNFKFYLPEEFCWLQRHMSQEFVERNEYKWEKTVVCAHTTVKEPLILKRLIGIDTGCVYKDNPLLGRLTAVVLPERRIVQVR
jgi:serine/threonine protein phosphatase 1